MIIGYHASHEQFAPSELLTFVRAAESAGFGAVMTSDHITPWSARQGNSGNNWAWLGAALASTSLPFGSLAIPGGWRYHPVVLAHIVATLSEMYPDRLRWIALGSGEAMNEAVVGAGWPEKDERDERLEAGARIIRALLSGEEVTVEHEWFSAERACLWSLPAQPPALIGAALTPETAGWMGTWADGLVTVRKPVEELREIVRCFRTNGGRGKPLALQLQISWGPNEDEARLAAWDQWRCAALTTEQLSSVRLAEEFDELTADVAQGEMDGLIPFVVDGNALAQMIEEVESCGFDEVYIHNVSRDQIGFIEFMARDVIPRLG